MPLPIAPVLVELRSSGDILTSSVRIDDERRILVSAPGMGLRAALLTRRESNQLKTLLSQPEVAAAIMTGAPQYFCCDYANLHIRRNQTDFFWPPEAVPEPVQALTKVIQTIVSRHFPPRLVKRLNFMAFRW